MRKLIITILILMSSTACFAGNVNNCKLLPTTVDVDKSLDMSIVEQAANILNEQVGYTLYTIKQSNTDYDVIFSVPEFLSWYNQNTDGVIPFYHGSGLQNFAGATRLQDWQHCRVYVKPQQFDTLAYDRKVVVVAHELGHCLGLGHSTGQTNEPALMSANSIAGLTEDDIEAIKRLYDTENTSGYGSITINNVSGSTINIVKKGKVIYSTNNSYIKVLPGKYKVVIGDKVKKVTIKKNKNKTIKGEF